MVEFCCLINSPLNSSLSVLGIFGDGISGDIEGDVILDGLLKLGLLE